MDNILIMCHNLCYVTSEHESYLKYRYFLYLLLLMLVNMHKHMGKVVIEILQGSAVAQTVLGGLTIHLSVANLKFPIVYMCQKLWKLAGSRQSYCKNKQAYFFGPPCIFPETRVIALLLCRWQYGSIFIQICTVGSKRHIFSAPECVLAIQGHPRSMILVPIKSVYATSYLSPIVTMVLSCTVCEIWRLVG